MRTRLLFPILLLFSLPFRVTAQEWFDLEVKVITTGEHQSQKEIGTFGAELPSGGKGNLARSVTIRNQTRKKSNDVDFKITFAPQRAESGELHVIFTSESTPRTGKPASRFRDLRFDNPTNQVVEIFSDQETGTHILIAISVKAKEMTDVFVKDLKVVYKCKVEKVKDGSRELIDSYDLQAIGDTPVRRTLTQKVPVWVEGETGEVAAVGFKELNPGGTPTYLNAGEGFTYTPPKSKKQQREEARAKRDEKKKKKDTRVPMIYQKEARDGEAETTQPSGTPEPAPEPEPSKPASSGSFNWEKEEITFEISSSPAPKGTIKAVIKMNGVMFDQTTKNVKSLEPKEETKSFANGEMAVFELLDAEGSGFILNVQPFF